MSEVATILVVDDEMAILTSLQRSLERLGYDVLIAEGGAPALEILDSGDVDLVVMDINMPDMDGIELLLAVRERAEKLPIVAMSGGGVIPKKSLLADAEGLGADATLTKPFELTGLKETVESLLRGGA